MDKKDQEIATLKDKLQKVQDTIDKFLTKAARDLESGVADSIFLPKYTTVKEIHHEIHSVLRS